MTTYWQWRPVGEHPDAWRCPPWPMSEEQAAQWSARWGAQVEKIEGTEREAQPPRAPGK